MLEVASFSSAVCWCLSGFLWDLQDVFPVPPCFRPGRTCNASQPHSTFAGPLASIHHKMLTTEWPLLRLTVSHSWLCKTLTESVLPSTAVMSHHLPQCVALSLLDEVRGLHISLVHVIDFLCRNLDQIQQFLPGWKCHHSLRRQFCQIYRSLERFASGGFVMLGFPEEWLWCLLHMLQCHMLGSLHCLAYLW